MDGWTQVHVQVPLERLGEFYERHGRWLQSLDAPTGESGEPMRSLTDSAVSSLKRGAAWRTGPEEDRLRDAKALYRSISPSAKRILDYWIDRQGERVKADDLVGDLGFESTRTVSGTLASFTFQNTKGGERGLPFFWEATRDGTYYWMEPDVTALFARAKEEIDR